MRCASILVLLLGLLLSGENGNAVPAPNQEAAEEQVKKLQGNWTVVAVEVEGTPLPAERFKEVTYTFKGNKIITKEKGEAATNVFRVDVTKNPKHFDITEIITVQKLRSKEVTRCEVISPGIYLLEGDTLKICSQNVTFMERERKRPTEFRTQPKSHMMLIVLKRQKP